MANIAKKEFTFVDYLTFITAVTNKVIENGEEYKRFYIALIAANMFFNYEPETNENGDFNMNQVWNDLRAFNGIKDADGNVVFANVDLYKICQPDYNEREILEKILPIDFYVYDDMLDAIDDKLYSYTNRDTVKEAATNLINKVSNYVDEVSDKFNDLDIKEIVSQLASFSQTVEGIDKKAIISEIASKVHADKININVGGTKGGEN